MNEKYPGGLKAYAEKHNPICNDKIAVACDMGGDTDDIISDLEINGLKFDNDYAVFDAARHAMSLALTRSNKDTEKNIPIDLNIEWLNAHFDQDSGVKVWYNEEIISE